MLACGSSAESSAPSALASDPNSTTTPGAGGFTNVPGSASSDGAPCQPGETRACNVPPQAGVGACRAGSQSCQRVSSGELTRSEWSACVGSQGPVPEVCNGLDDDCNGEVDDAVPCKTADAGARDTSPEVDAGPPIVPSPCSQRCTGTEILLDRTATYGLWVKVVLCSPTRYDLLLGPSASGPFSKIGDLNNSGQDHCELVDPSFTLGNEATITSGNCPTCDLEHGGRAYLHPEVFGTTLYYRYNLGQQFSFTNNVPVDGYNADTACWYECGVTF